MVVVSNLRIIIVCPSYEVKTGQEIVGGALNILPVEIHYGGIGLRIPVGVSFVTSDFRSVHSVFQPGET